jgi:hypothetical protein
MERKESQRNMTTQKTNKNIIEDLVESERDKYSVADFRRMMKICSMSLIRTYKNNSVNSKSTWIKK